MLRNCIKSIVFCLCAVFCFASLNAIQNRTKQKSISEKKTSKLRKRLKNHIKELNKIIYQTEKKKVFCDCGYENEDIDMDELVDDFDYNWK